MALQACRLQILRSCHGSRLQNHSGQQCVSSFFTALQNHNDCWIQVADPSCCMWCRSRVFILGPSHHFYTRRCCLSPASHFETPLGELLVMHPLGMHVPLPCPCQLMAEDAAMCCPGPVPLSAETYRELEATGEFDMLDPDADEVRPSPYSSTCSG